MMLGEQIEYFYASIQGMFPFMLAVFTLFVTTPFVMMVLKGRIIRAIESLGRTLLGLIAMMSIILFPVGVVIIWGVYKEAASLYRTTEHGSDS